jgi:hypothetical protein
MAQFCLPASDRDSGPRPVVSKRPGRQRFVVIVSTKDGLNQRAFGLFRSFKRADGNAKAWGGFVLPVEAEDAAEPWNTRAEDTADKAFHRGDMKSLQIFNRRGR